MEHVHLEDHMLYDGRQIEPSWAFRELGIKGSSIVTWIGPMRIEKDKIIDYEDRELDIKADEMIHFIVEHFDCQPADIRMTYHRQRLFVMIVKDVLAELGIKTRRSGDDLYIGEGKLSVSIATCSNSSMKIHFGINLISEGTPEYVETVGLYDIKDDFRGDIIERLVSGICENYIREISSIEKDITKTKVF
ncbi:MAG: DUF366 family protein [Euryarchaeota archaeon]|nr:DUF366 family protein [Euryarchaeota archaeon]